MLTIDSLNQYYGGRHITALLRCLMGVVPTKSGAIAWNEQVLTKLPTWSRVAHGLAYVPQGRDIFPRLSVEENLLVGAASKKRAPSKVPEHIYRLFPVLEDMKARRGGATNRPRAFSLRSSRTSGGRCASSWRRCR